MKFVEDKCASSVSLPLLPPLLLSMSMLLCQLRRRSVGVHRKDVCGCHFNCLSLCVCARDCCVCAWLIFINTASFLPLPVSVAADDFGLWPAPPASPFSTRPAAQLLLLTLLLLLWLGVCHKARQEGAASLPPGNHWAARQQQ